MRVLLVSHRFPPDQIGGVERYTQALASDLTKQGDDVSIVARRSEPGRRDALTIRERLRDGTRVYRLAAGAFRYDRFLDQHDRLDQLFGMVMVESMPDVVHINHLMGFTPNFIQIAHRLGAAVVISLHDF